MMRSYFKIFFTVILFSMTQYLSGQGFGNPLTMQGVDHFSSMSVASRGGGGTIFGIANDASLMFSNPASLQTLQGIQITAGSALRFSNAKQVQQYAPLKYYSNFSLLMEGLTGYISNPQYDTINHIPGSSADTVQRPFDAMGPNWERSETSIAPFQLYAAAPITIGETKISIGVGTSEYSHLDWYFQNNNVLSPSILSVDPFTTTIPGNNSDSTIIPVQWYHSYQQREGSIQGYGGALAVTVFDHVSFGVSGMMLKGSSNDKEARIERGKLKFHQNYFDLDSVYYRTSTTGTSDYNGQEFTISGVYQGKFVTTGFSFKLPVTITRTFSSTTKIDTTGAMSVITTNGEDKIVIPLRGTFAVSLLLRENVKLGFEYGFRSYNSAEYTNISGSKSKPWLSSNVVHVGIEYKPITWTVLRAGIRGQSEVFEPEGNPFAGDPVSYSIYSLGMGITVANARINIAYEYSKMKYVDMWASDTNINSLIFSTVTADASYEIPW